MIDRWLEPPAELDDEEPSDEDCYIEEPDIFYDFDDVVDRILLKIELNYRRKLWT